MQNDGTKCNNVLPCWDKIIINLNLHSLRDIKAIYICPFIFFNFGNLTFSDLSNSTWHEVQIVGCRFWRQQPVEYRNSLPFSSHLAESGSCFWKSSLPLTINLMTALPFSYNHQNPYSKALLVIAFLVIFLYFGWFLNLSWKRSGSFFWVIVFLVSWWGKGWFL